MSVRPPCDHVVRVSVKHDALEYARGDTKLEKRIRGENEALRPGIQYSTCILLKGI